MEGASKEVLDVIYGLLPGFIACWIFYGLTAHPKSSTFERVVQALIFTAFIKVIVLGMRAACHWVGTHWFSVGMWSESSTQSVSVVTAVLFGLILARLSNNCALHNWLREWKLYESVRSRLGKHFLFRWIPAWQWTERSSLPGEWFSAFHRYKGNVVLHLSGQRRLFGYPEEWADGPERGHIILMNAVWLLDDGKTAELYKVARIMVAAKDVEMVEFLKDDNQITVGDAELERVQSVLVEYRKMRSPNDGIKVSTGASEQREEPESAESQPE